MTIDLSTFEPGITRDPYPFYAEMRKQGPVQPVIMYGLPVWFVTGYAEARELLADPRLKHDRSNATPEMREKGPWLFDSEKLGFSRFMLGLDAPDHTRLRKMINKVFTPRRVEGMRPWIHDYVEGMFAKILPAGHSRWMDDMAYPVPGSVIGHMLGVPKEDHLDVRAWTEVFASFGTRDPAKTAAGYRSMMEYFEGLIIRKRKRHAEGSEPQTDLLAALVHAQDEEGSLNDNELLGMCFQLVLAGFETTANLLSSGIVALIENPQQQAELRSHPELLRDLGDEMVRFEPPVKNPWFRFTVESVPVGDVIIPAGSVVAINLAAANRDPAKFTDPDTFDVHRDASGHLGFSRGPHFCFGGPLGKLIGEIVFGALLRFCDNLALAGPPLTYRPSATMRTLKDLEITFTLTPAGENLVRNAR